MDTAFTCSIETCTVHATLTQTCSTDLEMQHGHGYSTITWTCRMAVDRDKQHLLVHAACPRPYSTYMGMQHEHRHAASKWTSSIDIDMKHRLGHAASTWTCSMDIDKDKQHILVHAACPIPYSGHAA
jgi:hypothetical protein